MTPFRDETALIAELHEQCGNTRCWERYTNQQTWCACCRAAEVLDAASRDTVRAARAYNESLDHLVARLRVVEQERDALQAVCEEARYCAVVLAHAYRTDNRPPDGVLASVRAWAKEKA